MNILLYPKLKNEERINIKITNDDLNDIEVFVNYGMKLKLVAKIYGVHCSSLTRRLNPDAYEKSKNYNKKWLKNKRDIDPEFRKKHNKQILSFMEKRKSDVIFKRWLHEVEYRRSIKYLKENDPKKAVIKQQQRAEYDKSRQRQKAEYYKNRQKNEKVREQHNLAQKRRYHKNHPEGAFRKFIRMTIRL